MKYFFLVPDGAADEPLAELGNQTPLQAAKTPNMDWFVQQGLSGLVQTIPSGFPPGSDIGNMALLGYDARDSFSGRSPLEAAAQSIVLNDDQLCYRTNFVTIQDSIMVDYSSGHISTDEADVLIQSLNEHLGTSGLKFITGKSYRHLLITDHCKDVQQIQSLKTTPPHDIIGQNINSYLPQGFTSEVLNDLMQRSMYVLKNHPVNLKRIAANLNHASMIWIWGQGTKPQLPTYQTKYGLTGAMISAVDLVNGLGKIINFDLVSVPGATGYYDTNYAGKGNCALEAIENHDCVYVHVESPDEAGHNGDAQEKVRALEQFDEHIAGRVRSYMQSHSECRVLISPDHPTPVAKRTHTSHPVCFVIAGQGIAHNGLDAFNEICAERKGVLFTSGKEMINYFIQS